MLSWIGEHFKKNVISRRTEHPWASHSPDLNPCDFFLWGYMKDRMMGRSFESLAHLRARVSEEMTTIPIEQCRNDVANFVRRLNSCIAQRGKHLEH